MHIAAIVRDKAGKAASLPVTVIVTRPDGVEHRRFTLTDAGLGGREITLPLGASAMTGTWRAKLHADPESDAITQVSFLVEDFVPERLDLKLEPPTAALSPDETQTIKAFGRYLYGPPAEGLAIEGDIVVKPSNAGRRGLYRLPVRPGRREHRARAQVARPRRHHRREGQRRHRRDACRRCRTPRKPARGQRHPAPARDGRPHH